MIERVWFPMYYTLNFKAIEEGFTLQIVMLPWKRGVVSTLDNLFWKNNVSEHIILSSNGAQPS